MKITTWKNLLWTAVTTFVLAACSVDTDDATSARGLEAQPAAVGFNAYLQRGNTRAGSGGSVTTASLKADGGFGVMAYYDQGMAYGVLSLPTFMYNQQVTWDNVNNLWTYAPVKYWPYEADGAQVTFFAYAPYVEVNSKTGIVTGDDTNGITNLSSNTAGGDPFVKYRCSLVPDDCVDLCWATPLIDQDRPSIEERLTLNFHHALASLNVQIDANSDLAGSLASATRVYVRSITFEGFDLKGVLCLNGNNPAQPQWSALTSGDVGQEPITIHDGRRDGREGVQTSSNEKPVGLNPDIVQSSAYITAPAFESPTPGVTDTPVNLFCDATDADKPIYVIPAGLPLRVTIVYDVETYDAKLSSNLLSDNVTPGSSIENRISALVTDTNGDAIVLRAGTQYKVNLHLGLTSVKIDCGMEPWEDGTQVVVTGGNRTVNWTNGGTTTEAVNL